MTQRSVISVLGLVSFFIAANPVAAQTSAVTAGDVVDKETLKAFVLAAKDELESATTQSAYQDVLRALRSEETWRKGSIYLFIMTTGGVFVFHGDDPDLEGEDLIDLEDANGVKIVQDLLAEAAGGGGYVEYLWPDPAVLGDEETGSPKVSFAVSFSAAGHDDEFVVGSGFYTGSADDVVNANEVLDGETLKAFVERAKARLVAISDAGQPLAPFFASTAQEGDWKYENTYLVFVNDSGTVLFHANDETAGGKNLNDIEDARGNKVVQDLIAAAAAGGGPVEYYWDDPDDEDDDANTARTAYATSVTGRAYGNTIIVIGGYYQDVSHIEPPGHDDSLVPHPAVTAADVTDRKTLMAFVRGAARAYGVAVREHGTGRYTEILNVFRAEEGDWRHGPVYLFILNTDGDFIFHAADRSLEARNQLDLEDVNGILIVQELIKVALAGGGFVQYHYDDPSVSGDEDVGSPKVSYAESFTARTGRKVIFGAGIHVDLSDHVPEITLSVDPESISEGETRAVTVTATQTSEPLPVSTRLPLSLSGTAGNDDYRVSGEMHVTIPADSTIASTELTFTVLNDAAVETGGETIVVTAEHDREPLASATITVEDGPVVDSTPAVVHVVLTRNGLTVSDATVEFSRSISGRAPEYLWAGTTDGQGNATIQIQSGSSRNASGYYRARARDTGGNTLSTWSSIPINSGEETTIALPVGGRAQKGIQNLILHPNAPNPFNPSTQIAYQIPEAGHVSLAIYNALGQQVRVLVTDNLAAGIYRVTWDGTDMQGRDVSSGVYFYRLIHSSGVLTRRLLFVK